MALKIAVVKNHLPACPSPFVVRSGNPDIVEYEKLIDNMAKGRTTLTKTDILAAMQLYREELQKQLSEGKTVKTPTGAFSLCAAGTMESLDESFLPRDLSKNHDVRLHHRPEKEFEESVLADLEIIREERPDFSAPSLRAILASGSETPGAICPGDIVSVKGLRLRFDPKDSKQGLFFADASEAETRSPFYPMIQPGTIMASVPAALAVGSYAVILRAAVNGKDIREARLEDVAIVTPSATATAGAAPEGAAT